LEMLNKEIVQLLAIMTSNLTKRYGGLVAVQNLNLEMERGEIL